MKGLVAGLAIALALLGCGPSIYYSGIPDQDLRIAAIHGDCTTINRLLDQGVGIEARAPSGFTALHFAAEGGQNEAVKLLVKRGAKLDQKSYGGVTPLLSAVHCKREETAKLFVKLGARTDIVYGGKTIQQIADKLGVRLR